MKNIILAISLFVGFGLSSGKAQAYPHYNPFVYKGWVGGYYTGWGYFPWYAYPVFPIYGYSYWSAFNYAPYYASYGAISVSKSTGRVGISWGKISQQYAFYDANAYCGAADCSPVVWVQGGCAAIAKSNVGKNLAWGYHSSKNVAMHYALQACQMSQEPGCRIEAWVCSY